MMALSSDIVSQVMPCRLVSQVSVHATGGELNATLVLVDEGPVFAGMPIEASLAVTQATASPAAWNNWVDILDLPRCA